MLIHNFSPVRRSFPAPFFRYAAVPSAVAWACLAAAAAPAFAQTLAPVTVTATRTELPPFDVPASVDVIDGERLRGDGHGQLNLSESLSLTPGIQARDRQNQAQDLQLSVRGFGARSTFGVRGVRIYVDGIPATMPDGQGQLSHIDLGSASRVEVLRGPYSALYGNSSGGVVQVFTEQGDGPPVITPSFAFGSDGFYRGGIRAAGSTGMFGYSLGVSKISTDGYRDHSAADRTLGNARLDLSLGGGGQLTLIANRVEVKADDPLGLERKDFDANPRGVAPVALLFNTRKTVTQTQGGLVYTLPLGGGDQLRAMVYTGARDTVQFQAIPVATQTNLQPNRGPNLSPGGVIDLERSYSGIDLRWTGQMSLASLPLEVVAGLSYDTLREQRRGYNNFTSAGAGQVLGVQGALRRNETNHAENLDPYAQATWKIDPKWTLNAGIRRSNVKFDSADQYIVAGNGNDSGSTKYSATLPVAGVTFAATPDLRYYMSAGKGFETPTFNEIAYLANGATGLNLGLKPSRSNNVEVGVKWRTPTGGRTRVEATAAVFQTRTRDEIVTQTNTGGRATFQNAGATRRQGLELATSVALPQNWLAQLSYTWLDARYRDSFQTCALTPCPSTANPIVTVPSGNRIPGIARSSLALEAGWRPAQGLRGGVEARYLSSVPVNDANTDAAGSYFITAAHVGYVLVAGQWRFTTTARVDNLSNKKYAGSVIVNEGNGRFFEPAAGRTWLLSASGSYSF
jgi:iron complex outermembrane recepter protein